jgi:fatty acid desaturase
MDLGPDQRVDNADLRAEAVSRLQARQGFQRHALVFGLVNILLIAIWLATAILAGGGAWFPWPIFPLIGWGIGLALHGWAVYGKGITEADIQREMNRLRAV